MKNIHRINGNIYITNYEEIKEGDCVISLVDEPFIFKCNEVKIKNYIGGEGGYTFKDKCKKIILTTDQDLIQDGVQAIDDEFLEWFEQFKK